MTICRARNACMYQGTQKEWTASSSVDCDSSQGAEFQIVEGFASFQKNPPPTFWKVNRWRFGPHPSQFSFFEIVGDEVAVYEDSATDDSNYIDMSQYHSAMTGFGMEQPYDYRGRR